MERDGAVRCLASRYEDTEDGPDITTLARMVNKLSLS
jgi:hypothetical protein